MRLPPTPIAVYHTVDEFLTDWQYESRQTQRLLDTLTDASLAQPVEPQTARRTLGRLAWHVVQTIPEMVERTGLAVGGVDVHAAPPATAGEIAQAYAATSRALVEALRAGWTDAHLAEEHDMYGERWSGATVLHVLVVHQAHHRGQMTVLMRQAGLTVPGVYGPAEEEWSAMGMAPPAV